MFSMNLQPRLLELFLALAQTRNFTAAADRVHMSQSAFSQAISRLESQVGMRLFERSTRNVSLTPEGELLLPMAQHLVRGVSDILQTLRDHAEGRRGRVAIAALPGASAEWIPGILAGFRQAYPGIRVRLFDTYSDEVLELIRSGVVDFGINRQLGPEGEFEPQFLFDDPHYLVCRADHPLARRRQIRLAQLEGHEFIHPVAGSSIAQRLHPYMSRIAIQDTGQVYSNMSTAAGLVLNGMGVTVVAGQSLFNFERVGLRAIRVTDPGLNSAVYLVKRRGQVLSVAASALAQQIMACLPDTRRRRSASPSATGAAGARRRAS
jgi:LysR family transcriptional regulator, carnitine catabolism transcriptional activator